MGQAWREKIVGTHFEKDRMGRMGIQALLWVNNDLGINDWKNLKSCLELLKMVYKMLRPFPEEVCT